MNATHTTEPAMMTAASQTLTFSAQHTRDSEAHVQALMNDADAHLRDALIALARAGAQIKAQGFSAAHVDVMCATLRTMRSELSNA